MSKRLQEVFNKARAEGRALFIPYVTGGYPLREDTVPILLAMEAGGADVIEIGVPFTDPLADGATIQHANHIAVASGITLHDCFGFVRDARAQGLKSPVLFMGYYNPVLALGEARTAMECAGSGGDGFIIVDLPPEEAGGFLAACRENEMSFVPLVSPTTSEDRVAKLAAVADAFIYCVSVTGTTGRGNVSPEALPDFLARVRRHTDLPLVVGFGVTTREHVIAIGAMAEGVAVGSAVIAVLDSAAPGQAAADGRAFVEKMTGRA